MQWVEIVRPSLFPPVMLLLTFPSPSRSMEVLKARVKELEAVESKLHHTEAKAQVCNTSLVLR